MKARRIRYEVLTQESRNAIRGTRRRVQHRSETEVSNLNEVPEGRAGQKRVEKGERVD